MMEQNRNNPVYYDKDKNNAKKLNQGGGTDENAKN
jgi:hypothetical protein